MPPKVTKQTPNRLPPKTPPKANNTTFGDNGFADNDDGWGASAGVRLLVYGRSGTGKTTFCSTLPGKLLWLLCSGGNKPGELKSIDTPENRKRITPKVITDSALIPDLLQGQYDGVVLDHATGLADLILKEILGLDEIPVQKSWGLASQQQYGQLGVKGKELFRAILGYPGNVAVISHERVFNDEGSGDMIKPTVGAALTPTLTGWLNGACDYVVQTFIRPKMEEVTTTIGGKPVTQLRRTKKVEFCLRTEQHETFMTKFRMPGKRELPECIVDPSYDKMMELINGKV